MLAVLRSPSSEKTSGALCTDDGDGADVHGWRAAEVVGHSNLRVLELPRAGATLQLQVHLIKHAESGSSDGVSEAFESAIDLTGHLSVSVVEAVHHVLPRLAFLRNVQVFHRDEFGDREAVVHFHH